MRYIVCVFEGDLDMGTNYIYNVKTPINNDQGVNKSYAYHFLVV